MHICQWWAEKDELIKSSEKERTRGVSEKCGAKLMERISRIG